MRNPLYKFSRNDVKMIDQIFENSHNEYNSSHTLLNKGRRPTTLFDVKPISDGVAIKLWNEIFDKSSSISSMDQIDKKSEDFINRMDVLKPDGIGFTEKDFIRYVTAQSKSSFYGIQKPSKSLFAFKSMEKTLNAHSNPRLIHKPWLFKNLDFLVDHIYDNPSLMNRDYGDVCLHAKMSSSSIPGEKYYRDFVLRNSLNDIIEMMRSGIDYLIFTGTRMDKRGKYRLICSFNAVFRILDFYINNGSYSLCEKQGLLSCHTTEGFNNKMMWPELMKMTFRDGYTMLCIDYSGYDTQIAMLEYLGLSKMLNRHRMTDEMFSEIMQWYETWLRQPKPLVTRSENGYEVLIPYYRTLASGLHGTHSFENLIGISTCLEIEKIGVDVRNFWTNGDDQNLLVRDNDVENTISFLEKYFVVNWKKSLIGHSLSVWGKLWFTDKYHPFWEIGTFRSIWEKESGSVDFVEESKFESNYCKIIQIMITLRRLGKSESRIEFWCRELCKLVKPNINPDLLPVKLQNIENIRMGSKKNDVYPKGLMSAKKNLKDRDFSFSLFKVNNYFDMLLSLYVNNSKFSLDIKKVVYHPKNTTLRMKNSFDYSINNDKEVPFMFQKIVRQESTTNEDMFVRSILNGTNSYDGPVSREYKFNDMMSLAVCLDDRNRYIWTHEMR